jgi:hypothetical protein
VKLSETLLVDCEEFFDVIANEAGDVKLDRSIESLRNLLERDADGWTYHSDETLARATQCRLMEIWNLIPKSEKNIDPDLREYYDYIVGQLEDLSGYETDDDEEEDES